MNVPGAADTYARGISGNDIVGFYYITFGGALQSFLYDGSSYTTLDVPGAEDIEATGISGNDIVGWYDDSNGDTYSFLATPAPEPSAMALLAIGAAALLLRRR